jgi:hypothetical protein
MFVKLCVCVFFFFDKLFFNNINNIVFLVQKNYTVFLKANNLFKDTTRIMKNSAKEIMYSLYILLLDIGINLVAWIVVFVVELNILFMLLKGFELKENLEMELQQCYKAQSLLYEQLVKELYESRVSKALLQEKENAIADMQKELTELRLLDVSFVLEQSLILFIYFVINDCDFKLMLQFAGNKRLKK